MDPLFSFIVPVYNSEKYLTRCLDSVFAQTCKDFEVIVVDDCSPGDCAKIVKSYLGHIRYTRHDRNRSLLQARITGGKLATGKYLISLDSDDFVSPGLTQALADEIKVAAGPDIVVYHMVLDDGTRQTPAWHNRPTMRISAHDMLEKMLAAEVFWPLCGKAVRRDTYLKAIDWLGVNADFYLNSTEDMCQMLPVLLRSQRVSFIEYVGYHYWHNPDSLSKSELTYDRLESVANQCQSCVDTLIAALNSKGGHLELIPRVRSLIAPTLRWFMQQIDGKCDGEWNRCVDMLIKVHGAKMLFPIALRTSTDFLCRYRPDAEILRSRLPFSAETIGVLCHHAFGGGAENATLLWARRMAKSGKRVVWICDVTADPGTSDILAADGIATVPIPVERDSRMDEIGRRIGEFKIDVVLFIDHWHEQMFRDLLIVKSLGCRAIVADHSSYFFPLDDLQLRLYLIREKYYPLADVVTVLSPANVSWYHAAGVHNVVYMPNFLTFDVAAASKQRELSVAGDIELLVVGKLCVRKNAVALLEAFSSFRRRWCGANRRGRLTFLGRFETPQYEQTVRDTIVRLGISDDVVLAGEHDDVSAFFRRATVMMMASRLEGAPMVLMEAKAHAVPTVMFSLPYVAATDECDGVVSVPFGDTEAMARAVYDCVSDPVRYRTLSVAARRSLENFSPDKIMARWERVFSMVGSGHVEPLCETPPAANVLEMTMKCLSLVVPVLDAALEWRGQQAARLTAELSDARQEVQNSRSSAASAAAESDVWRSDALRVANSRSYKIGRMMTWPYRMVRNTSRCYRDNGFWHTLGRIPMKFVNLWRRFFG